ncbi:SDR family NAD(P)-dependent oxidoreductase [Novosphingobium cyanobacteriorum]|uniref:SDR family NAD(P)-dependent oxidoreductase n=1 Tax=Novosphingobium cyanobacteriorum TaxID=3024215 RepID=A0ABT6CDH8_9SPHN|nr:SDR family oxidoreductase [Novosphingobium cyanobacteriorum]MDF8331990.1 SDR family NAD(P)-dependent oxidoreductase [Novosphingobium cyanobacteriorum]
MTVPADKPIIIVTGAGSGMGRAIAQVLLAQGLPILLAGRRRERLDETVAGAANQDLARVAVGDLGSPAGADALLDAVCGCRVSALVASAGGQGDFIRPGAGAAAAETAWLAALRMNLFTAVLPIEAVLSRIIDGGRIILIGSTAGIDGQGGPYATAKAALAGYGRDLARRVGGRGITVNTLAPGFISDTDFFEAGGFGPVNSLIDAAARQTLLGQVGRCDDVVAAVDWLLGPGGRWVTGQTISVNGGTIMVQ